MAGGAPKGNKNGAKAKIWELAMRHEIAKDRERLYRIADRVLKDAEAGEAWAVTEVRNTMDGKPTERMEISDPEGTLRNPAIVNVTIAGNKALKSD